MCSSESEAELSLSGPALGTRKRRSGDSDFTFTNVIEGKGPIENSDEEINTNYPDSEDDFVVEKKKIKTSKLKKLSEVRNMSPKLNLSDQSASTGSYQAPRILRPLHFKEEASAHGQGDYNCYSESEVERPVTITTPDQINSRSFDQEEVITQSSCSTPVEEIVTTTTSSANIVKKLADQIFEAQSKTLKASTEMCINPLPEDTSR